MDGDWKTLDDDVGGEFRGEWCLKFGRGGRGRINTVAFSQLQAAAVGTFPRQSQSEEVKACRTLKIYSCQQLLTRFLAPPPFLAFVIPSLFPFLLSCEL